MARRGCEIDPHYPRMKITEYCRSESESRDDLDSALEGRVFHCTKLTNLVLILADGEIKPNADGMLPSTFGSSAKAYFRQRNCVSVFDYRFQPTEEVISHRMKCSPFQPAQPGGDGVAILFIKPELYGTLLPWTNCKDEVDLREMVVPFVEAGHPGPIAVSMIEEVICVTICADMRTNASALAARLRAARQGVRADP